MVLSLQKCFGFLIIYEMRFVALDFFFNTRLTRHKVNNAGRVELLSRYKQAKSNRIKILNIRKLYL